MTQPRRVAGLLVALSLMSAGCAATPESSSPTAAPTSSPAQPTPAASNSATPSAPATASPAHTATPRPTPAATSTPTAIESALPVGSVVVTFQVESEEYRVLLTETDDIDIAEQLLAGEEAPPIPNGRVLPGDGGVNSPWSWHIDPQDIEFADVTTEVCDGLPSFVESGALTSDRYCPWSARVISIEPANG